jgi:hypothetical protein
MVYYFGNSSAVAMQYGKLDNPKYNEATQKNLKGIPQFLFHVPTNKELVNSLIKMPDVRVMLVGRGKSVNFAKFNRCNK